MKLLYIDPWIPYPLTSGGNQAFFMMADHVRKYHELSLLLHIHHNEDKNKWDGACIKFRRPLRDNECTVVNVKTENDDFDGAAKPWISCNLETPIEMMLFRVMLSYKPDGYNVPAIFERKKVDTEIDGEYEYLESVEFNAGNKLYSFCKITPEPGYIYRLRWEK